MDVYGGSMIEIKSEDQNSDYPNMYGMSISTQSQFVNNHSDAEQSEGPVSLPPLNDTDIEHPLANNHMYVSPHSSTFMFHLHPAKVN